MEMAGYVARLSEYQTAYAAWETGANVSNENGSIVISGPPALSADKAQIENDSSDAITVTCDLGDPGASDEIRWKVIAPSFREIGKACFLSAGTTARYLDRLEFQGRITRIPGQARSIRLVKPAEK